MPDFDARVVTPAAAPANQQQQQAQAKAFAQRGASALTASAADTLPGVRVVRNARAVARLVTRDGGTLTGPSTSDPETIARNFIRDNPSYFLLTPEEASNLRLTLKDVTAAATFLAFNQSLNGVDVFEGQIKVTVSKAGEVVAVGCGDIVPGLRAPAAAKLSAEGATVAALKFANLPTAAALTRLPNQNNRTAFANPSGTGFTPIITELSMFPASDSSTRLAYRTFIQARENYYEMLVDANTGALLFRQNLTSRVSQGRVWTQSPLVGSRQLVTFPDAWMSGLGNITTGNNVDAFLDSDGDGQPDSAFAFGLSQGRAYNISGVLDFPFGDGLSGQNPRGFQPAAITNAFYFINQAHDYFYNLGFTEAAGNFQTDNFGKGGVGNDAVIAQVQCGATDLVKDSFQATVDGVPPKMCIALYTRATSSQTDDLDPSFSGQYVIHEYAHGVSNRLVGGGTNTTCLGGMQSGALAEGWSDYFAISYFNNPVFDAYLGQSPAGLRRQSYDGYTFTYEDIGNPRYSVYNDGEIWAATLWDIRKSLGAAKTDQLVVTGLKTTPCRPSMPEARDQILKADETLNGGANRAALWQVFARHGLGYYAAGTDGSFETATGTRYDANFDLPPDLQPQGSPRITSDPLATTVSMGSAYNYNVTATNPNNGALNFALTAGPANMSVGAASGAVNWNASFTGQRVKITVTDGKGGKTVHGFFLPVVTPLTAGVPLVIGGSNGLPGFLSFRMPSAAPAVQFTMRGGTGDADLVVTGPNESGFSFRDGTANETLTFALPASQSDWLIEVDQFQPYSGVTINANAVTPAILTGNGSVPGLGDIKGGERLYRIPVPGGATLLSVSISGGSGNADLLLKAGSPAVCQYNSAFVYHCVSDYSSKNNGNADTITITNPVAGDWYIDLFGADAYSGVTLTTQVVTGSLADLTISKTHTAADSSSNFTRGQTGTYSLVVTNAGGAATFGQVTVTDTLPAALTATAMSGNGWSCNLGSLTCTRSDALGAGGSYPPITLTVSVPSSGPGTVVTNSAAVSGGGDSNSLNNTTQDVTPILSSTPTIDSLLPNAALAGAPGFTLTVRGNSFLSGAVVQWNGSPRPTTYVSTVEVRATISAADVANVGTAQIAVVNAAPGGPSSPTSFTIGQLSSGQWTNIAAAVVGPLGPTAGRVTGIAPHPTNGDIVYISTTGGGVWKTVNGGGSWTPLTDAQQTLTLGSIAVAPSNPNVIYAGTGDPNNWWDVGPGAGIMVSTDGGVTWTLNAGPSGAFNNLTVSKIAIDPTNPSTAYAVLKFGGLNTKGSTDPTIGVWKTTNTGASWVKTAASDLGAGGWIDVQIDQSNPNVVYASAVEYKSNLTGVYKTTSAGASWAPLGFYAPASNIGSIAFAVAPSNPQVLYVAAAKVDPPYGLLKFARSDTGGSTFIDLTPATPDFTCTSVDPLPDGALPMVLAVDRQNPMIVYAGGGSCTNSMLRSIDGGAHWTAITLGTGKNHRALAVDANGKLLDGNDFGIWRLTDPVVPIWTNLNTNLATLQMTGIGLHPTDVSKSVAATVSVGTDLSQGTTLWKYVDNINSLGTVKFSPLNPNRVYRSFYGVRRSDDGGLTWVNKPATDTLGGQFPIHRPFAMDGSNPNRLVVANYSGVAESLNGGDTWARIASSGIAGWAAPSKDDDIYIYSLALAPSDPNVVYAGSNSKLRLTTNHGSTWTVATTSGGAVLNIQVSPTSAQTVYIGTGGGIYKSVDGGQSWSNISGNLGGITVFSVQVDWSNPNIIYIGALDGVYRTTNGGGSWSRFGSGLPNSLVFEIELNTNIGVLAAATDGRGVWAIKTATASPASIAVVSGTGQSVQLGKPFGTALQAKVLDASSNPVAGVTVTFTAPSSGASATFNGSTTATAVTDAAGIATSPVPTANATTGSYNVAATVNALSPANFSLTNTPPPPPASVLAFAGTPQSVVAGSQFGSALQAKVLDAGSNPVAGVTVTFTAQVAASGATATFGGNASTTAVTDASGTATSTIPVANNKVGTYNVTATVGALPAVNFALTNLQPPPASVTVLGGTPQSTQIGTSFPSALQVKVLDANSNPVPNVNVLFAAPGSGASASFGGNASATVQTDASGVATSPIPMANGTAGTYNVTATVSGLPAVNLSLTNTSIPPASIAVAGGSGQSTKVGTSFGSALQAKVLDANSNPVPGVTVTFTAVAGGTGAGATFNGNATATATTNASGIATSPIPVANNTAGPFTVTASLNALTPAQFSLTNTPPPPPASIVASAGTPQSTASGTQFGAALQAQVLDANSNPVAGVTVTFTAPGSGASATFNGNTTATAVTNVSGIATSPVPVANSTNGGYTVTASVQGLTANFSLTNTAPPPGSVQVVGGAGQSTLVGTAFPFALQVKVLDTLSNPVSGVNVTFAAPGSGASATFGGNTSTIVQTNASGIAISPIPTANGTAGTYTVTASVPNLTPAQFTLTNTPPPPASVLAFGGTPQSTTIGAPFAAALQAKVLDANSNPVAGVTVIFATPGSGPSATLNGNTTATALTNASGIATSPTPVANGTAGSYQATATVSGLPAAVFSLSNTMPLVTVSVAPKTVTLGPSGQQAFTPTVTGTANTAVTWSLQPNVGSMNGNTYTAPASIASIQTVTLTAASVVDANAKDTATVTLRPPDATIFAANLAPANCNVFGNGTELGLKFRSDVAGQIRGIRFYKNATDNTAHTGTLWNAAGQALATGSFTNETASGWQTLTFANPVAIAANTTYVASYHTNGWYCSTVFAFSFAGVDNAPLHALKDGVDGPNGVSVNSVNGGVFPNQSNASSNFFVDVLFAATPPQQVGSVTALSGTPQNTSAGTQFGAALQAKVLDTSSAPIAGVTVTFTAPGSGASATFNGNATATATTDANGVATVAAPLANSIAGTYNVTASASGFTANFSLTNNPLTPASISAVGGTPQTTVINTAFGSTLKAKVLSAGSLPVAGVTVTFTAPASGQSAAFGGSNTTTAVTDASGIATSSVPVANGTLGSYVVAASVNGVASTASFNLTNSNIPPPPVVTVSVSPKTVTLGPSGQQAFTATVGGTANTAVTWSLQPNVGTMNGNTYTAPASIASKQTVILTATTQADNSVKDTATITLQPPDATIFAANAAPTSCSIFGSGTELGTKFRSDVAGQIRGIRFYKNATDNTAHTGTLWSAAGVALATGTFTNETSSGWQTLTFANPVSIAANTTYVASYHTNGWYCSTAFAFFFAGVDNAPLHALKDGVDGPNGVFVNTVNGGVFPNQGNASSNFFVDVLFASAPAQVPASISVVSGTPQTTPIGRAFGSALKAKVMDSSSNPIAGVSVTFAVSAPGAASATLNGGAAVTVTTDASGVATSPVPVANSFTGDYTVTASVAGVITPAIFFLTNGPQPAPASLMIVSGNQQTAVVNAPFGAALQVKVLDASSLPVSGITVSFLAPPLSGASATFNGSVNATALTDPNGVATSPIPVANGIVGQFVVAATIPGFGVQFNLTNSATPLVTVSVSPKTVTLGPSGQQAFTASVGGTGNTAVTWSLQPNVGTMNGNTYTAPSTIASLQVVTLTATSQADNTAKDTATISLKPPDLTIFAANAAPTGCNNIAAGTELGLKFRSDVAGQVKGIRFYKNATDNTAHTGTLWSAAGAVLATGTFTGESASGWQTLTFANPVTIAANTTYVVSYHTNGWYCSSAFAFTLAGIDNPPLHALKDGVDGPNGVFVNTANGGVFPTQANASSNFFVDVLFSPVSPQTVGSVAAVSGTPQTTVVGTAFGSPLQAKVLDTSSNPIAGLTVTFAAPGSGAGATIGGGSTYNATTDANGVATAPAPVANLIAGPYNVTASAGGFNAQFSLTNTTLTPASIAAFAGTPQTTPITKPFGSALQAKVLNAALQPVAGVVVTFTAPGAGASATFNGNTTATATTDASGVATSPIPVANGTQGGYSVTASVGGVVSTASFSLTNGPAPAITVAVTPKTVTLGPSGQQAFTAAVSGTGNTAVTWSLQPNVGSMNGNTYSAPATIATKQTVTLTATSQADNTATDTATITLQPPDSTIFPASAAPSNCSNFASGTELGVKFRSDVAGQIRGIRFYKNAADNTTHTGTLWSSAGVALATGTFVNETASGWQTLIFANPVSIAANTTYVASYHTNGWYCSGAFEFTFAGVDRPPLHALKDGVDGPNGVYVSNQNGGVMPTLGFTGSNYYVDVLFMLP